MARRAKPQPIRSYRVGGSVRDELLGVAPGDRDFVVVGATPEIMLASGFTPVGRDFPVFLHPDTHEEYALARTERKAGRGYRGFEFFATPEVSLEEDLRRRDLSINAMARDDEGRLIDPCGGEADLRRRILRHVSPAFVEDPLRVLRVARFAARFGFRVAPSTMRLMRTIVDGGELATLAPERVWQELARGLGEAHPSRMLAVLERCGAFAQLLPELDPARDSVQRLGRALDRAAKRALPLAARYAILVHPYAPGSRRTTSTSTTTSTSARIARVESIAARLRVPADCRDAARLLARWQTVLADPLSFAPVKLLELVHAADALRRPNRLDVVLQASREVTRAIEGRDRGQVAARTLAAALEAVRSVDAAAIARRATVSRDAQGAPDATIAAALRAARLAALGAWRRREIHGGGRRAHFGPPRAAPRPAVQTRRDRRARA